MAKLIMGAAVGQASGSVGGVVFTKGPFGLVMQIKGRPHQSPSNLQLGIRGGFQTLSKRWALTLTDTQQAGWVALAQANPVPDIFGNMIKLLGVQFYIKLNGSLRAIGSAPIDDAPGALSSGNPGTITVVPNISGGPNLNVTPSINPTGTEVPVVWSMRPVTVGQHAVTKTLVTIQVFPAGTAGPWNILTLWNQKYGELFPGQFVVCKVRYTENTTGFQGTAALAAGLAT